MIILTNIFLIWSTFFLIFLAHDLAQLLVAKKLRIDVESFNLGYGPIICRYQSKKSITIYAIKAIPLKTSLIFADRHFELDSEKDGTYFVDRFLRWLPVYPAGPIGILSLAYVIQEYKYLFKNPFLFIFIEIPFYIVTSPILPLLKVSFSGSGERCAGWLLDTLSDFAHLHLECYPRSIGFIAQFIGILYILPLPILDGGKTVVTSIENYIGRTLSGKEKIAYWAISSILFIYCFRKHLSIFQEYVK